MVSSINASTAACAAIAIVNTPAAAGPPPSRPAISHSVPYLQVVVVTPSAFSMTSSSSGGNDRTTDGTPSEPRDARDGGDPVVRRETGDQTDQESRSAEPRAAASVAAMDITIHARFVPHDDPDASLAFYRDRPEVVPVVPLLLRAGPC